MGKDEKKHKGRTGVGRNEVLRNRKGWVDKGSEGMRMTRNRKGWENIERNGKGWEILEKTGMNEKGGKPEGWERKVREEMRKGWKRRK